MVTSADGGKTFDNSAIADKSACQCCATVSAINPVDSEIYTSSRSALKNGSIALNNETRTDYMNQEQNSLSSEILQLNAQLIKDELRDFFTASSG